MVRGRLMHCGIARAMPSENAREFGYVSCISRKARAMRRLCASGPTICWPAGRRLGRAGRGQLVEGVIEVGVEQAGVVRGPPRLAVLGLLHLPHLVEPFEPAEVGLERAAAEQFQVLRVHAVLLGRQLEVTREPLVEPQRHVLQHAVQQGVRELVAEVGAEVVAGPGEDLQVVRPAADPRLGDEVRPPRRQVAVPRLHVPLVPVLGVEQDVVLTPIQQRIYECGEEFELKQGVAQVHVTVPGEGKAKMEIRPPYDKGDVYLCFKAALNEARFPRFKRVSPPFELDYPFVLRR